mgnify:FL=1
MMSPMVRVIVRYDGPGDVYVLPAHALEVTRGGHIAVGAGTAEELVALEHDKFTVLGVETQPVPVAPAPKRRRKRGLC